MLISHDLHQTPRTSWSEALARHTTIHKVDFVLVLEDGSRFASKYMDLPEEVRKRVRRVLRRKPPPHRGPPPPGFDDPQRRPQHHADDDARDLPGKGHIGRKPPWHPEEHGKRPHLMMRTRQPTLYWSGVRIPLPPVSSRPLRLPCCWRCPIR